MDVKEEESTAHRCRSIMHHRYRDPPFPTLFQAARSFVPCLSISPDVLRLAAEIVLFATISSHDSPMRLIAGSTALAHRVRLPGLVKGLKRKNINTPSQHTAD